MRDASSRFFSTGTPQSNPAMTSSRMKSTAAIVASVLGLVAFGAARAHGDHQPEHGGTVGRGDDSVFVEFVVEKGGP
jgi:hypothetical protein